MFLPVSPPSMKLQNYALFMWSYLASLKVRPQIIHPPQPTALSIPFQSCSLTKNEIRTLAILLVYEFNLGN